MEFNQRKRNKHQLQVLPTVVVAEILLYLPIDDILALKTLIPQTDLCSLVLIPLLSSPDQGQFRSRFSENVSRVLNKSQLLEVSVNPSTILNFCAEVKLCCQSQPRKIYSIKAIRASTDDGVHQDIRKTLDGHHNTWWSSNPGKYQDKEDWLLYDLGGVILVDRIGIAAWKSYFHGRPIFGFQRIWIELGITKDSFYYQTQIHSGSSGDELQCFYTSKSGPKLSARFIKIWLKGCTTKCFDGKWYFTIKAFQVWGWHNLPWPIGKVSEAACSSKKELLSLE